jgi:hypothetical protein
MWRCDESERWGREALSNVAADWFVFVPCIKVISGSNLSPRTGHRERFIVFSFCSAEEMQEQYRTFGYGGFFCNLFCAPHQIV